MAQNIPETWEGAIEIYLEHKKNLYDRYNRVFSLLRLEIDHLDRYSEEKTVLIDKIKKMLMNNLRETDLKIEIGRIGFYLILSETGKEGAILLTGRIQRWIKRNMDITISCATGSYPDDTRDVLDLIKKMKSAMERAKEKGGDKVETAI